MRFIYAFVVISLVNAFSVIASAEDAAPVPPATPEERRAILKPSENDIIIGKPDAPVTLVEYASLSCSHCAAFHTEILPSLKEKYVEKGTLKVVFRHFPLNLPAVKAAALVECVAKEKKDKFLSTLFKTQKNWAFNTEFQTKLKTIAKIGGVSEKDFDTCMGDKTIETRILDTRLKAAQSLKVESTPTLFINGEMVEERTVEALSTKIDKLL